MLTTFLATLGERNTTEPILKGGSTRQRTQASYYPAIHSRPSYHPPFHLPKSYAKYQDQVPAFLPSYKLSECGDVEPGTQNHACKIFLRCCSFCPSIRTHICVLVIDAPIRYLIQTQSAYARRARASCGANSHTLVHDSLVLHAEILVCIFILETTTSLTLHCVELRHINQSTVHRRWSTEKASIFR